jgi:hypothetical protein
MLFYMIIIPFIERHIRAAARTADFGADRSAAPRFKLHCSATAMAAPVTAIKRFREI